LVSGAVAVALGIWVISWLTDPDFFENRRALVALIGSPAVLATGCYFLVASVRAWRRGDDEW